MDWKRIAFHTFLIITSSIINEVVSKGRAKAKIASINTMIFWPEATVPFMIDDESYDADQIDRILQALKDFEFKTCIRFRPIFVLNQNVHSLYITNKLGIRRCQFPTIGHSPDNAHTLVIGYNCLRKPDIETLLMKAMGFSFEHNRPTRDEYISVMYENIEPASVELFTKDVSYPEELAALPYDINSVMHFDVRERSMNGHPSFMIKDKRIGLQRRPSLSPLDIKKFSIVYGEECRKRDKSDQVVKCEKITAKNPSSPRRGEDPKETRRQQDLSVNSIKQDSSVHKVSSTVKDHGEDRGANGTFVTIVTEATAKKIVGKNATELKKSVPVSRSIPDSDDNTLDLMQMFRTSKRPSRYANSYLWRPLEYIKPFSTVDDISPSLYERIDQSNAVVETDSRFGPQYFESRKSSYDEGDVKIELTEANKRFYNDKKRPDNVIKYIISDNKDSKEEVRNRLNQVDKILKSKTCVRLEEISNNPAQLPRDYVVFDKSDNFNIGYTGRKQIIGSQELFSGKQHEQHAAMLVMAVLGFPFECSRHDRDEYVRVNMPYILPEKRQYFTKRSASATLSLPYDFQSATQPPWKFWRSKTGTGFSSIATYKRLDPDATIMKSFGHHRELLSKQDIVKINSVYGTECGLFSN